VHVLCNHCKQMHHSASKMTVLQSMIWLIQCLVSFDLVFIHLLTSWLHARYTACARVATGMLPMPVHAYHWHRWAAIDIAFIIVSTWLPCTDRVWKDSFHTDTKCIILCKQIPEILNCSTRSLGCILRRTYCRLRSCTYNELGSLVLYRSFQPEYQYAEYLSTSTV